MTLRFQNYVVLILGGTSGIGLETSIQFINQGAKHVIISGRSYWKWTRAKSKIIELLGPQITSIRDNLIGLKHSTLEYEPCDVRLEAGVQDLIEIVIRKYKYINVYFNNAGTFRALAHSRYMGMEMVTI